VIVTGRIKNVIIRSGLKIQAEEVEEALLRHPSITHAVIVGVSDPRTGERAVACIVVREEAGMELSQITSFLDEQGVAKFKWPEHLLVVPALPVNAAGKFDRVLLREQLRRGV
jgi:non-ribosomal peptide synthetase component E (peptide arylation enzyme)